MHCTDDGHNGPWPFCHDPTDTAVTTIAKIGTMIFWVYHNHNNEGCILYVSKEVVFRSGTRGITCQWEICTQHTSTTRGGDIVNKVCAWATLSYNSTYKRIDSVIKSINIFSWLSSFHADYGKSTSSPSQIVMLSLPFITKAFISAVCNR